jgi:undecaprenyl-diphosphatase
MDRWAARRDPWTWVGLAGAAGFALLAALVVAADGAPLAFDEPIADVIRSLPLPVDAWIAITNMGGRTLTVVGTGLAIACLAAGRVRLALIVALAMIGANVFTDLAKDVIGRPRPPDPLDTATSAGFPSGHALNSVVTYGLVALLAWRSSLPRLARDLLVVLGVTTPVLIGVSRVALGVHWPSDVLAGWLAGLAFVALAAVLIDVTGAMARDLPRPRAAGPHGAAEGEVTRVSSGT